MALHAFDAALTRIPVSRMSASLRWYARLREVFVGAVPTFLLAAAQGVSLDTLHAVSVVWAFQQKVHGQTDPEIAEAIFELVTMYRGVPFGADAFGPYFVLHEKEAARHPDEVAGEYALIEAALASIGPDAIDTLDCPDGTLGRFALGVMAGIDVRPNIALGELEVIVQCQEVKGAYPSLALILASCLAHNKLPAKMVFCCSDGMDFDLTTFAHHVSAP